MVVSVEGRGPVRRDQVSIREMNEGDLLMRCRKRTDVVETWGGGASQRRVWWEASYRPGGDRHKASMTRMEALVRNLGTCRSDAN